ncbi:MAG: SRPBCC domain-containing protein [Puniceicoccaceae bacterium]
MQDLKTVQCVAEVPAPIDAVWEAWTTEGGVVSFFAPAVNLRAEPDGPYEILFNPDAPEGTQGAEGMRFLALQEPTFLSFTWNAPPHLPEVRGQRTWVEIRLEELDSTSTRVQLLHGGWGTGGQWEEAFDYFVRAWGKVVLPRLVYRFENGPVDWSNPPAL